MPRIVMAPDSFKGTLSARDAATALADGWRSVRPEDDVVEAPMADGGEGTLDSIAAAVAGAVRVPVTVPGHDGAPVEASWLRLPAPDAAGGHAAGGASGHAAGSVGAVGVVELAQTSGIELLGGHLRPQTASTLGFGVAIADALAAGVSRLVLAIGSSASTDGGVGVLRALGARFTDAAGAPIGDGVAGLEQLVTVDLEALAALPPGGVRVLTDVTNPLLGPRGAASVFGPQKGLDAGGVVRADAALARLAGLVQRFDPARPGAGAAGGTGWALGVWGAELVPGAPEIAALTGLTDRTASAGLVITGEGSYDSQSAAGKVPAFVASLAPGRTALVAGRIDPDAETLPFEASVSLTELAGSRESAVMEPARWLRAAGALLARKFGPELGD